MKTSLEALLYFSIAISEEKVVSLIIIIKRTETMVKEFNLFFTFIPNAKHSL